MGSPERHAPGRSPAGADERLRLVEQRYRMLVESMAAVTYMQEIGVPDPAAYMSPQIETLTGYTPEECMDPALRWSMVHPEDRERMRAEDLTTAGVGDVVTNEYRVLHRDGRTVWVRNESVIVEGDDGARYWQGFMVDITDRKEAEEALRRSEEHFRSLVRNSSDVITVVSGDGTIRYVSPAIEAVLGYRPEDRVGGSAYDLLHPDDVPGVRQAHEALLANPDVPVRHEARMRHRDGSWRHVEAVLTNRLAEPSVEGLVLNWRDTTEREQALRAQHRSEERYRLAALATNEAIWDSDIRADRQRWDGAFEATFGYPQDLVTDEAWWRERIHPDDRERVVDNTEAWLRGGGETWTEEYRFRCADGTYATVVDRAMVVRDGGGRPVRMAGSMMDVTERRRAEEALRRSEERYRLVARAIDEAIWDNDIVADRQVWDGAFEQIFGYPQGLVTDEAWWRERVHPDDRRRMIERIDDLLASDETSWTEEYRFRRADGTYAVVEDRAMFVRDARGRPVRMIGTMMDVTEHHRSQEEIRRLNADLERQVEERTRELREALNRSHESEERLSMNMARFRSLVRNASDIITIVDADARIVYTTVGPNAPPGYSLRDLQGTSAFEYVHPEDVPKVRRMFERVLAQAEATASGEIRCRGADGSWRDLEVVYTNALHDASVGGVIVNSRDVTERKRAERRLHAQYELTRALEEHHGFDAAADAVLAALCRGFGWDAGSVFFRRRRQGRLRCYRTWHEPGLEFPGYVEETRGSAYDHAGGVIGQVWSSGRAVWIPDIARNVDYARRSVAVREGLRSAAIVPILARGLVVGVLEVLCRERREEEPETIEVMSAIGAQIGQFIERRRAEEELRESEERLRVAFDQAAVGFIRGDLDGLYIAANQAFCEMVGYEREEVLGKHYTELSFSAEAEIDTGLTREMFAGERSTYTRERPYRHKDGSVVWTEHAVALVRDSSGEPVEFVGVVQDITERRRIEEARRQSESLYRAVVEQAAENIFIVDAQSKRIVESNPALRRSLGYTEGEIRAMTLYDLVDHDRASVDRNVGRVLSNGGYKVGERRYRRKDGSLVHVEVNAGVVSHRGRQAMCVVAHDVTERKAAEDNFRHSLEVLLALYEAGQVLTSSLDLEEIAPNLLDIMRRVASLSAAVIYLRDDSGALQVRYAHGDQGVWAMADDTPPILEARAKAMSAGAPVPFRIEPPGAASRHAPPAPVPAVNGLCLPLRVLDRPVGVLEVYGSTTLQERATVEVLTSLAGQAGSVLENARLYTELTTREKRLEELVGKLISTQEEERRRVSYEVHDGLAQVAASAHQRLQAYAWRHAPPTDEARKDLERVLGLVRRTVGEARKVIANLRPTVLDDFGLAAAVNQKVDDLRDEGWQVQCEVSLGDERLPVAVETALYRVAQEALTNARKHARTEGARLRLYRDNGVVTLRIEDRGQGFDPAALEGASGPGERVGLSGMRERVSMVGGEIEVRSRPGAGTSVAVRVPVTDGNVSAPRVP